MKILKPYDRCLKFGPGSLSDSELLAVILRTGVKGISAVELATDILQGSHQKGLLGITDYSFEELIKIKGVGNVKAIEILCIAELSKRMTKATRKKGLCFNSPETIAQYYMEDYRHKKREEVLLLLLNTKSILIKEIVLSKGTVNASFSSPREIFVEALRWEAVNIILIHNHPSGDATPSKGDIDNTRTIVEAGKMIGVNLIDHIIIGDNQYVSLRQRGVIGL